MTRETQSDALRRGLQTLFRRFGVLSGDQTPCGKPLAPAHAHALMALLAGPSSQQALGRALGIDKSNVARLCAKLVELGQVTQVIAAEDARGRLVALTAKGERLAREVEAASRARFDALLSAVPRARRRAVLDALDVLTEAMTTLRKDDA